MLRLLLVREYTREQVQARVVPSGRRIMPEVEAGIETAWRQTLARPGIHLFDGPIYRFEAARAEEDRLWIDLSTTSYRILVGTNFCNPHFADQYGRDVMANSMGVSTGLLTEDGHWMMGRRNRSVAYYPGRVHPFAGSIELADKIDLFANAERELREELHLLPHEIFGTQFVGLVEDTLLEHPESIFLARTARTRGEVAAGLDADEHDGVWSVPNDPAAVAAALADAELTPVARAVLLLGGHVVFGQAWFDSAAPVGTESA